MNHDEYKETISAFLDGELTDAERDGVLAHLETCEACRAYLAELTALRDALGGMEDVDVPEGFAEGVMTRLREEELPQKAKKRNPWRGVAALAACAAVVVLAGSNLPRMGGSSGSTSSAPTEAASIQSSSFAATTATTTADSAAPEAAEDGADDAYAAERMMEFAAPEATETPTAAAGNDAGDEAAAPGEPKASAAATAEAEEFAAGGGELQAPVLTLMGDGAADWLAEHAEPLGGGRWLVTVEAVNALPDTLALVAVDGLQEPADGTLIIMLGTTENPR